LTINIRFNHGHTFCAGDSQDSQQSEVAISWVLICSSSL